MVASQRGSYTAKGFGFETVEQLVDWRRRRLVTPNPEYQRAAVWSDGQKKKLIDSIMRGYKLPVIYLHLVDNSSGGLPNKSFDIIDGQQRINALHDYIENAFPLYAIDDRSARFPQFLLDKPCPWGGKLFRQLPDELKARLLETEMPVAKIETEDKNEVRDLFVRLQAGLPLNPQEKRDAYPGAFAEYILRMGGKSPTFSGHPFFKNVRGLTSRGTDRGRARTFAAQLAMLFLERRIGGNDIFVDTTSTAIDDYYYRHLDFDADSVDCDRLWQILDKLTGFFRGKPMLYQHEAIHLVLLLDTIWDGYTRSWEGTLVKAHGEFVSSLASARATRYDPSPDEAWVLYGQLAAGTTGQGQNVRRRHRYYSKRMVELMGNLTPKDPKRAFGVLEREVIYWRDRGVCQHWRCNAKVDWPDAEIHHVTPHKEGGRTLLNNGALVHSHCHPKSDADVSEFAENWEPRR